MRIHFACIYNQPHFISKQTFARIDFLRQGGRLVSRKGTHNVKILTENKTIVVASCAREWANGMESTHVYVRQSQWLQGMQINWCIRGINLLNVHYVQIGG